MAIVVCDCSKKKGFSWGHTTACLQTLQTVEVKIGEKGWYRTKSRGQQKCDSLSCKWIFWGLRIVLVFWEHFPLYQATPFFISQATGVGLIQALCLIFTSRTTKFDRYLYCCRQFFYNTYHYKNCLIYCKATRFLYLHTLHNKNTQIHFKCTNLLEFTFSPHFQADSHQWEKSRVDVGIRKSNSFKKSFMTECRIAYGICSECTARIIQPEFFLV